MIDVHARTSNQNQAAVCVGLYPNVLKLVRPPTKYAKVNKMHAMVDVCGGGLGWWTGSSLPPNHLSRNHPYHNF